ncbi:MAG TPA: DegT/DnrJ/EryC1/StrS family aminotransferase, partial [Acidimicrobiales bacterium]|nr:DegT/DnrJ/EryC1/StrS family aminotransferase [Acidimicrobiales bacterium]
MKSALQEFAVAGGDPAFDDGLPVGQLWFSGWDRYQAAMEGILERQYYTNHGPLIRELEANLEQYLGVRNAVTVTNATLGLYLVAIGLGLRGKVMMPAFSFIATAQAAVLADLEPV